ncbi:calcium-binding protein [Microvirga sp. ACRRW]|uniref:calcium-binding protein n=1 Tax=Microvirga sp. ACRRW TaxID=2918205 RepID=UPI001EF45CC3|nr:calcium-binding protein [Microvirga sp. ACRRW]MCG7393580.1 calcium-binding protein [Microvirga sp. ACRRW]
MAIPTLNIITANAGAEVLEGTGGAFDVASYRNAPGAVTVVIPGSGATNGSVTSAGWAAGDEYGAEINGIEGTRFDDTFYGNGRDNFFLGGAGADTFWGGDGIDTISYQTAASAIAINIGYYEAGLGDALGDRVYGIENVIGSDFNDSIIGSDVANLLEGGRGNDTLQGSTGADTIDGGEGIDTVSYDYSISYGVTVDLRLTGPQGGAQETNHAKGDILIGIENIIGTKWADNLTGNDADNVIDGGLHVNGGSAVDVMAGKGGNDIYYVDDNNAGAVDLVIEDANAGTDLVYTKVSYTLTANVEKLTAIQGQYRAAVLTGNNLNNTILGNEFANTLNGGDGNDTLDGAGGADRMVGGKGNDVYYVNHKSDKVIESSGQGTDTIYSKVSYTISNYVEKLIGEGSSAITLSGNGSSNTIIGNAGKNTIKGNGGNDVIDGGLGNDVLYGGTGKDAFVFSTALHKSKNVDTIKDFVVKDDTIRLENAIFTKLTKTGKLNKSFFKIGDKAKDKNDYLVYNNKTGALSYDADGSGKKYGLVKIAQLEKGLKMTHADFLVF